MEKKFDHIVISRTDSIGDVILTLPMAGWIKQNFPKVKITFIGRSYTVPVIRCSIFIDNIINWDDFKSEKEQITMLRKINADVIFHVFPEKEVVVAAKKAEIKLRVATGKRKHTVLNCNKLLWFSRKKSDLHESQLNLKMLSVVGLKNIISLDAIPGLYGFSSIPKLENEFQKLISKEKINLVLHPKSKGSAIEWGLSNFSNLVKELPIDMVQIFITGTKEEKKLIGDSIPFDQQNVIDLTGKMSLDDLIAFLQAVDVVVAGSTGPIHIAAALGTKAVGLYSPLRPIYPGRWMPIGTHAKYIVANNHPVNGSLGITVNEVKAVIFEGK